MERKEEKKELKEIENMNNNGNTYEKRKAYQELREKALRKGIPVDK